MVLNTRSCSRLTMLSSSSPSEAMTLADVCGAVRLPCLACPQTDKQGLFWRRSSL